MPTIRAAIRNATIDLKLVPVLCGSALKNKGVQPLIDAIVDYLPSPVDIPPMKGQDPETGETLEFAARENEPLAAIIFKVAMMEGRKLSFIRIYSGKIKAGEKSTTPGARPVKSSPEYYACMPIKESGSIPLEQAALWGLSV